MKNILQNTKLSDASQQCLNWNPWLAVYVSTDNVTEREWLSLPLEDFCTILGISIPEKEQQNDGYVEKKP